MNLEGFMGFQFLGIPPKGERTHFFISLQTELKFPISRDPPEGGTCATESGCAELYYGFQFLGIPPKGERSVYTLG